VGRAGLVNGADGVLNGFGPAKLDGASLGVVFIDSGTLFPELGSSMPNAGRAAIIFFILFSVTKLFSGILSW